MKYKFGFPSGRTCPELARTLSAAFHIAELNYNLIVRFAL